MTRCRSSTVMAADFLVDSFAVSYGDPQPVAVTAKRSLKAKALHYSINGGPAVKAAVEEWAGGERYGFENDDYYAEYRGVVEGVSPGDSVEVWFSGQTTPADLGPGEKPGKVESEHFTYTLAQDTGNSALVIANEDYTGVNPTYPAGTTAPKYVDEHVAALEANGVTPDVWDVDAQGVPHHLGVLSHFESAFWYLGDNRLTQDPEDFLTDTFLFGPLPDLSVAERQQYLTLAVRDWLNEGGKLALAGETTGYFGLLGSAVGGIYYGLDGAPEEDCVVTSDFFSDCLLLADDFTQYWLGASNRAAVSVDGTDGHRSAARRVRGDLRRAGDRRQPRRRGGRVRHHERPAPGRRVPAVREPGRRRVRESVRRDRGRVGGCGRPCRQRLPAAGSHVRPDRRWPRWMSPPSRRRSHSTSNPATTTSSSRCARSAPTTGRRCPTRTGSTSSDVPTECEAGFYAGVHPQLLHYLTITNPCTPTGTTGEWNALTGSTGGWIPVSYDLSAYAGQQVELVVSYVTDPGTGGLGVVFDDTKLVTTAGVSEAEGFETGLGAWTVLGSPESSPDNASDWERAEGLAKLVSAVTTPDTIIFGFGLEQLDSDAARADVVARILAHFGR